MRYHHPQVTEISRHLRNVTISGSQRIKVLLVGPKSARFLESVIQHLGRKMTGDPVVVVAVMTAMMGSRRWLSRL